MIANSATKTLYEVLGMNASSDVEFLLDRKKSVLEKSEMFSDRLLSEQTKEYIEEFLDQGGLKAIGFALRQAAELAEKHIHGYKCKKRALEVVVEKYRRNFMSSQQTAKSLEAEVKMLRRELQGHAVYIHQCDHVSKENVEMKDIYKNHIISVDDKLEKAKAELNESVQVTIGQKKKLEALEDQNIELLRELIKKDEETKSLKTQLEFWKDQSYKDMVETVDSEIKEKELLRPQSAYLPGEHEDARVEHGPRRVTAKKGTLCSARSSLAKGLRRPQTAMATVPTSFAFTKRSPIYTEQLGNQTSLLPPRPNNRSSIKGDQPVRQSIKHTRKIGKQALVGKQDTRTNVRPSTAHTHRLSKRCTKKRPMTATNRKNAKTMRAPLTSCQRARPSTADLGATKHRPEVRFHVRPSTATVRRY
mmetsp:Transcript_32572/g.51867  ORF Transcript_32572/g.51867 Transcript_32572/m.51867 type:complete len:418 (-) Transcript_32572:66-1319(-)